MENTGAYDLDADGYNSDGMPIIVVTPKSPAEKEAEEETRQSFDTGGTFVKTSSEYLLEKSDEALEEAKKVLGPVRNDYQFVENLPAFKLLAPAASKIPFVLAASELVSGEPIGEVAEKFLGGLAGEQAALLAGTAIAGLIAPAAPVFVTAAIIGVVAAVASYYGSQIGAAIYDYAVKEGPSVVNAVSDFFNDVQNQLISDAQELFGPGPVDFSTETGQEVLDTFLSGIGSGLPPLIANLLSSLGLTQTPAQIASLSNDLSSIGALYTSAANAAQAAPAAQQLAIFNSSVSYSLTSLSSDVANAIDLAQSRTGNQPYTLADGAIITPGANGGFSIQESITGSPFGAVSTTSTYDSYGNITGSDTEYNDGSSEIISEDPTSGNVIANWYSSASGSGYLIAKTVEAGDVATTTSFDATGNVTGVDVEDYDTSTSTQTIINTSNHVEEIISYIELGDQGTGTLAALNYLVQPGDTFGSVASALGLGENGGAALAAINGQLDASAVINEPKIYVPASVGSIQSLAFDSNATVSEPGDPYQMTSETWTFATGGILTLSGGAADGGSFTPLTMEGTQDPGNAVYVFDAAGNLLNVVPASNGLSIAETIQDYPATQNNDVTTPASVTVSYNVGGVIYYDTHSVGEPNNFLPSESASRLPTFAESGGITTTASIENTLNAEGSSGVAAFNASDNVPDATWDIGVDTAGDAVFTGLSGSGYDGTATLTQGENGTPIVNAVSLGQSNYSLVVIPDGGFTGSLASYDSGPPQSIFAEGTGTTNIDLKTIGSIYWHVNGLNDSFTTDDTGNVEFYFAGPSTSYQLSWDGNANLAVTGGSTGTTTFHISSGTGEIDFSNGVTIGLGTNILSGVEANLFFSGTSGDYFVLDGGTQTVFGAANTSGSVDFDGGSDDPADWTITETAVTGQPIAVTFDGANAGYDGVATLSGIQYVTLNDIFYQLDTTPFAGNQTISNALEANIVVDVGSATLIFDDVETLNVGANDWFVGGQNDTATLLAGTTEIYLNGDGSSYSLTYDAQNQLLLTGGTTGTTTINLAGGMGEINFGDGSVIGIGGIEDEVEYAGSGDASLTVDAGGIAYGGSGDDSFYLGEDGTVVDGAGTNYIYLNGNQSDYTISTDAAGDVTLVGDVADRNGTTTIDVGVGQGIIFFADETTLTVASVACFGQGTMILTVAGELPVDQLQIGDQVVTASDQVKPILWMGRRSYAQRFAQTNPALWPIRFHAGSLGNGLPRRDLLVSGEHAMFLDGLLIPARHLTNGVTIVRERPQSDLFYFHIELDTHDVILAEGAASETFLDDDSRGIFHNAAEFRALYPNAVNDGVFCAPRVEHGYELEAVRQRLNAVALTLQQAA